jgi:hypothetical protein
MPGASSWTVALHGVDGVLVEIGRGLPMYKPCNTQHDHRQRVVSKSDTTSPHRPIYIGTSP